MRPSRKSPGMQRIIPDQRLITTVVHEGSITDSQCFGTLRVIL